MRLFIALELPEDVKKALTAMQDELRRALQEQRAVRWVAPTAMHLTLQFLGEVADDTVSAVAAHVQRHRDEAANARLHLERAGAFPNVRRPQTLWCGVGGDVEALGAVQADLARDLQPLGFEPDTRPFSPHLTLGRVRREASRPEVAAVGEAIRTLPAPAPTSWPCGPVILFQSRLTPQGPIYTAIET